jgi:hypothetical protein
MSARQPYLHKVRNMAGSQAGTLEKQRVQRYNTAFPGNQLARASSAVAFLP